MEKRDINKIFEYVTSERPEEVLKMVNDEDLKSQVISIEKSTGYFDDELIEKCINNIIDQMNDNNLYEYFEEVGLSNEENKSIFTELILSGKISPELADKYMEVLNVQDKWKIAEATQDYEYIKEYMDKNLETLDEYKKRELIKATGNVQYIKECVESDKLNFSKEYKVYLITLTKDKEYMKSFVKDEDISTYYKIELLKEINDAEYIKEYIAKNGEKLDTSSKMQLILLTNDKEYMKSLVESEAIASYDKIKLLKEINDAEYTKEYIANNGEKLDSSLKTQLILSTNDEEYMKSFVESDAVTSYDKIELIKGMNDAEYTKEYIANNGEKLDSTSKMSLILSTNDKEYMKTFIESDAVTNYGKIELIKEINDAEYTKEYIANNGDKLDSSSKTQLILSTNDEEYVKSFVESETMTSYDKLNLIKGLNDVGYIKECIQNEGLSLDAKSKIQLILLTDDETYIKDVFKTSTKDKKDIKLPDGMTIGVEIEAEGAQIRTRLPNGWKAKGDGSLHEGMEVVSPILTGSKEDVENIYMACNMLDMLECSTSERCGGHVHIGADFLKNKQAYTNLIELWGNSEELLYTISNSAGEITRENGAGHYATPLSKKIESALESGGINLENEEDLDSFISEIKAAQVSRYSGLNFMNLEKGGKNTIEFRLANGTINPDTWIENINLFGGIIASAEKVAELQSKDEEKRTIEEQEYLAKFELLKNSEIDNGEKLEALLDLTVPSEDKEIYTHRYEENSKILKENDSVRKSIKGQVTEKALNLKYKKKEEVLKSGIEATENVVTLEDIDRQEEIVMSNVRENTIEYENNIR